ncbi:MAG: HAMP domain-containing histidine kinase [Bacteroidales bacterium]|nr:HAMP domain-containing histidine kinase [Bacteroidales bacterium]
MKKSLLYILIGSICVSLLGIIIVQFFWIQNAFRVKEAQFNRGVNDALGSVINKMETRENMYFISRNFEGDSIMSIVQSFTKDSSNVLKERLDSLLTSNELQPCSQRQCPAIKIKTHPSISTVVHYSYQYNMEPGNETVDSFSFKMEQFSHETPVTVVREEDIEWNEQLAQIDSIFNSQYPVFNTSDDGTIQNQEKDKNTHRQHRQRGAKVALRPSTLEPYNAIARKVVKENSINKLDNKAKKIQNFIKKMAVELETKPTPLQQRINKKNLQTTLSKAFVDKGIDLPFEFAVFSPSNQKNKLPISSNGFKKEYQSTEHRVSLFPNDLFQKPDLLLIYFPGQKTHVFKSLSILLMGSILFTLIIILSSGTSIVVMIRQKKISDVKTDFINNMTHEFKTPIATISIAADSINNPKVIAEPETIKNFTRIIKEENNRMNARVEQVLQMALLDSRDFHLRPKAIDMHELIEKSVDHFTLQIEKREGAITTRLEATNPFVEADEDHMRNVLLNLLDNANKYSIIKPDIVVYSFNRSGKFFFGVQDKGIGMSVETQRRAFDKFFRLTSGNIHNIKGFGLGLSYVKAIVYAHHGEIQIASEIGKGSRFEINLPVIPEKILEDNGDKQDDNI